TVTAQIVRESAAIDPARVCAMIETALESLTDALLRETGTEAATGTAAPTTVAAIDVLPAAERALLVDEFNAVDAHPAPTSTLAELFEARVDATPDAVALVHGHTTWTYADLNTRANRIAHRLRDNGVGPDVLVGLCAERGPELIAALIGVLKAGGAYVPLDPANPRERLARILTDSTPATVLVAGHEPAALIDALLTDHGIDLPVLDVSRLDDGADHNPEGVGLRPDHLAYVIYTSGSTGVPKGVMVEHRNVSRLFSATDAWFGFGADDVWTLAHSYAFDFSVWELWGALLHGGRLVVVPADVVRSPEDFFDLVVRERVTVLNQTPGAFRRLVAAQQRTGRPHQLRYVVFGGEALDPSMLRPWYAHPDNGATVLVNMYGITETTVHVTHHPLTSADADRPGRSPIGRRIPDLTTYILDPAGRPAPLGVPGELFVGGAGVARGYLNRPELTSQRFVPDTFADAPDARLYRTGDLGRWLPDGSIEYLGRNDFQVKVRGFRIELGEIEARLLEHPGIREAVVLAREDVPGDQRLVAYYRPTDPSAETPAGRAAEDHDAQIPVEAPAQAADLTAAGLRRLLSATLPDYMVPSAFMAVASFPLTANGKLDRHALPAPDGDARSANEFEAPVGDTETRLAGIWSQVLGVDRVGRHDNFFELGGHSLLAVSLVERMREHGLVTDVRSLFTHATVAALARTIGTGPDLAPVVVPANLIEPGTTAITPAMLPLVSLTQEQIDRVVATVPGGAGNVQDIYPLGPLQEGMFFHHLLNDDADAYLLSSLMAFDSRDLLDRFVDALRTVVDRHDVLRTSVVHDGLPAPVQVVWRHATLPVEEIHLDADADDIGTGTDTTDTEGRTSVIERLKARFDPRRFRLDLTLAPMMRVVVAPDPDEDRWLMQVLLHHMAGDHSTLDLLRDEVQAHLAGRTGTLAPPVPYREVVAQALLGVPVREHEEFFTGLLGDVDETTAPYGLTDVHADGRGIAETTRILDDDLAGRIRTQARRLGVTTASVFHLAWGQVLARVTGRDDVVFGTVLFGRMHGGSGAERGLGLFVNTLPVRVRLDGTEAEAGLRDTHHLLTELLRHEHAPLSLAQRRSAVPAPAPLFTSLLNYRHSTEPTVESDGDTWQGVRVLDGEERTNYPVMMAVDDRGRGFGLTAQVVQDARTAAAVDPEQVCSLLATALEQLTTALADAPGTPLTDLDILPADERELLVHGVDSPPDTAPDAQEACLHERFAARALAAPDAVAVVHEGRSLTYAELNAGANRVAHRLRALGVGPDVLVGVCAERGLDLVV
ncbi:amino acid adenylation domain-containing protein, partial [Streptomyces sp. NPDC006012]|uniref:amino acid adenylation domain-containing protein n=1 Tax=Streptomyces sp. NPDC006012 TaxID=3364739 RepID=UPI0036B4674B